MKQDLNSAEYGVGSWPEFAASRPWLYNEAAYRRWLIARGGETALRNILHPVAPTYLQGKLGDLLATIGLAADFAEARNVTMRCTLIEKAFTQWLSVPYETRGTSPKLEAVQFLLSHEARQSDPLPDGSFNRWIGWVQEFSDKQATVGFVVPQAIAKISDNVVAAAYLSRVLSDETPMAWRPLGEAETAQCLMWRARFDGQPVAAQIDDVLSNLGSNLQKHDYTK